MTSLSSQLCNYWRHIRFLSIYRRRRHLSYIGSHREYYTTLVYGLLVFIFQVLQFNQQCSQSKCPLRRHFFGHFRQSPPASPTTAATKLLLPLSRCVGQPMVFENLWHVYASCWTDIWRPHSQIYLNIISFIFLDKRNMKQSMDF